MNSSETDFFEYIDFLENEMVMIIIHNRVFREVTDIIRNNPIIYRTNPFFSWMVNAYVSDITVRIRRLVDDRKDVRSLVRFLKKLMDDSTRDWAGKVWVSINKELIRKDINELKIECKVINKYTNFFITHTNAEGLDQSSKEKITIPTFDDLEKVVKYLNNLIIKYYLHIKAIDKGESLMPHLGNWKSIFKVPWLNS